VPGDRSCMGRCWHEGSPSGDPAAVAVMVAGVTMLTRTSPQDLTPVATSQIVNDACASIGALLGDVWQARNSAQQPTATLGANPNLTRPRHKSEPGRSRTRLRLPRGQGGRLPSGR
jgi:hypothetical protein